MKSLYPCKVMNISQGYLGSYSHAPNYNGSPRDYPWDEACEDRGRSWFCAPCDVKVARITGVRTSATNTIWLESTVPVEMPIGKDYLTIMVIHPEDDDLLKVRVGQVFKQGQPMFREGKDGKASGNHFHISVGTGKIKGNGWVCNSKGAWVLKVTGNNIKPEQAFFIGENTKVISSKGLTFEREEEEMTEAEVIKIVEKVLAGDPNAKPSEWAKANWEKCVKDGIVDGKSPKGYPTREQVVTMLVREE